MLSFPMITQDLFFVHVPTDGPVFCVNHRGMMIIGTFIFISADIVSISPVFFTFYGSITPPPSKIKNGLRVYENITHIGCNNKSSAHSTHKRYGTLNINPAQALLSRRSEPNPRRLPGGANPDSPDNTVAPVLNPRTAASRGVVAALAGV